MSNDKAHLDPVRVEGNEDDWMARHILLNVPAWTLEKRQPFKYNKLYSFWRAEYGGQLRRKIRDFELLKDKLPLPSNHNLAICGSFIYIRENKRDQDPCAYDSLIAATPLNSPVEPEAIWAMIHEHHATLASTSRCSFGHLAKSHVLRGADLNCLLNLRRMLEDEFRPQGYSTSMFARNGEKQPELMVSLTHASESFKKFLEAVIASGFEPLDSESAEVRNAHALALDGRLAQEEASLLQQLEAVRARRVAVKASVIHIGG